MINFIDPNDILVPVQCTVYFSIVIKINNLYFVFIAYLVINYVQYFILGLNFLLQIVVKSLNK